MSDEFNKADEGTKSQPREIPKAQSMYQLATKRFEHIHFSFLGEIGEYIREVANAGAFSIRLNFDRKDLKRPVMDIHSNGFINSWRREIGSHREFLHIFHELPIFLWTHGYNIKTVDSQIHISWDWSQRSSLFKGGIG